MCAGGWCWIGWVGAGAGRWLEVPDRVGDDVFFLKNFLKFRMV